MAHKRSSKKMEERANKRKIVLSLKTLIHQESYRDWKIGETVCLTNHETLRNHGYTVFGEQFSCTYIPDVDRGFVLSDCYGRGCFQ